MKKGFIISALCIAAAVLSTSCQKEESLIPEQSVNGLSFVSTKPSLTKTEWDGTTIKWSAGDAIRVGYTCDGVWQNADGTATADEAVGSKTAKLYGSSQLDAASATATFKLSNSFTNSNSGVFKFYGLYPSSAYADGTSFAYAPSAKITIPSEQTPKSDSFDSKADIMIGESVNTYSALPTEPISMAWDRMVAHAQITFSSINGFTSGEVISSVKITANEDAKIAGTHYITLDEKVVSASSEATNVLTLKGDNMSVDASNNLTTWAVLLPVTVTSLDIEIKTNIATYSRSIPSCSLTFKKNARNTLTIKMDEATRVAESITKHFTLVKTTPANWEGTYLIVWEDGAHATVSGSDLARTTSVVISDDAIGATSSVMEAAVTIEASSTTGKYYIKLPDGKYLNTSANNNKVAEASSKFDFTLTLNSDYTVDILGVDTNSNERVIVKNGAYYRAYKTSVVTTAGYLRPCLYVLE